MFYSSPLCICDNSMSKLSPRAQTSSIGSERIRSGLAASVALIVISFAYLSVSLPTLFRQKFMFESHNSFSWQHFLFRSDENVLRELNLAESVKSDEQLIFNAVMSITHFPLLTRSHSLPSSAFFSAFLVRQLFPPSLALICLFTNSLQPSRSGAHSGKGRNNFPLAPLLGSLGVKLAYAFRFQSFPPVSAQ